MCLQAEHVHDLVQEGTKCNLVTVDLELSGFDLGDVEQTLDHVGEVLTAALYGPGGIVHEVRHALLALENLSIAEDRGQRRAQFVAQAHDVFAFGKVRRFRRLLGLLQLSVGFLMGPDLVHQQPGVAACFFLGEVAAFLSQHEEPCDDAG